MVHLQPEEKLTDSRLQHSQKLRDLAYLFEN